jgi:hypothetical protein
MKNFLKTKEGVEETVRKKAVALFRKFVAAVSFGC